MAPNSIVVGGLDYNGNPTLKPFSDGARVDIAAAQIDRLEMRINDTFLHLTRCSTVTTNRIRESREHTLT
jgi:hypothetical protein